MTTRDDSGVAHQVISPPVSFVTMPGGIPGETACRVKFFDRRGGRKTCTWPTAVPADRTEDPVDCMACLVAEARR